MGFGEWDGESQATSLKKAVTSGDACDRRLNLHKEKKSLQLVGYSTSTQAKQISPTAAKPCPASWPLMTVIGYYYLEYRTAVQIPTTPILSSDRIRE